MKKPSGEEMVFAVLSYIPVVNLIPLLIKRDDDFVHFHAKQGLIIFLVWIVIWVISKLPFIGWFFGSLLSLALFIVCIVAIVKVLMGETWEIPVVSKYADKLKV